jgi:hypothetical protein
MLPNQPSIRQHPESARAVVKRQRPKLAPYLYVLLKLRITVTINQLFHRSLYYTKGRLTYSIRVVLILHYREREREREKERDKEREDLYFSQITPVI